jgi:hypothetical protein
MSEFITITGIVHYVRMGGGTWSIVTHDGITYELFDGGVAELQKDGLRVTITGIIRDDVMSFTMLGSILEVESFIITEK